MNSCVKTQKSFEALQEMTGMGWWMADRKARVIVLSAFLASKLQLTSDRLDFQSFKEHLHPDSSERVMRALRKLFSQNSSKPLEFLFRMPDGYRTIQLTISERGYENRELVTAEGFMRLVETSEVIPFQYPNNHHLEINKLLHWQKTFTQSLTSLLDKSVSSDPLEELMNLILRNYQADTIRMYEVDYENLQMSCTLEFVKGEAKRVKDDMQNVKLINPRLIELISNKEIHTWDELSEELYQSILAPYTGAKSCMIAPLISMGGLWGFIKIDTLTPRRWSHLDKEFFQSLANLVGLCLAFQQSEKQANKHSDFLHKLFFNMPLGYFTLRIEKNDEGIVTDYEYLDVNTQFTKMVGLSREQLVGKMCTEIGPIFVNKLDLQVLAPVAYQGEIYHTQGQMRHDQRYYNTTIYCPRHGDIVALFSDVTDTILASDALRKSEAEIKKVYTNIPVGIEIYDKNGVMVDVNDKELEIQGVSDRNMLLGLNLFEHPSLPRSAHDLLRQGKDVTFDVNAESMQVNYNYYDVSGPRTEKYLTIKCTVLYNNLGEIENYLLIVIDNTEMYQATSQLHEFEAVFNSVAKIAEIGLFRWNPLKKTSYGTEQYIRNMGLTQEEAKDFLVYRDCVHPNDVGVLEQFLSDAVAGKTKSITHEFRVRDGEQWKWLRTACFITEYEPENNNIQFIGVNYNINDMKVAEQQLIEAKSRAEEADRLKSAFLANMSHEIRTPLNAIVGFSGILVETEDKEDQQQFINIIKKNNDHLLNLVSDILDISKIESGIVDISNTYLVVDDVCNQVIESLSIRNEKGLDMRFIPNQEYPNVLMESDPKRINQILSNFLYNALKFTQQGHVFLTYQILDNEIELSVEDTGIGIAPEHIDSIFERFFKVDEFIPGTGLGLSICRNIAEHLGGTVGAESTLGQGSRFWCRFPLMPNGMSLTI